MYFLVTSEKYVWCYQLKFNNDCHSNSSKDGSMKFIRYWYLKQFYDYLSVNMKGQGSYVPPPYIPLDQLDTEANSTPVNNGYSSHQSATHDPTQWSSGICACFDDMQSCTLLSAL